MEDIYEDYLRQQGVENPSEILYIVTESGIKWYHPPKESQKLYLGLRLFKLGVKNVTYEVGFFQTNSPQGVVVEVEKDKDDDDKPVQEVDALTEAIQQALNPSTEQDILEASSRTKKKKQNKKKNDQEPKEVLLALGKVTHLYVGNMEEHNPINIDLTVKQALLTLVQPMANAELEDDGEGNIGIL